MYWYRPTMPNRIIIVEEKIAALPTMPKRSLHLMLRYTNSEITRMYTFARTATSTTVTMPSTTPRMTITGAMMARKLSLNSPNSDTKVAFFRGVVGRSIFRQLRKTLAARNRPIIRPGMKPPRKSFPIERPLMAPRKIMGMLGGMMGPMTAAAALMEAENSGSYFFSFMAGSRTEETAVASAMAEPEMPAMMTLTMMAT